MSPTREQLRQATQQRVVEAADRLFQERGFVATTIRDIAEASGVSVGTVMAVGDKDGLLVRVFDALITAEHAQRDAGNAAPEPGDGTACAERVMDLVQPFVRLFIDRVELARAYASILVSGHHASTLFTELAGWLTEEMRTTIVRYGCTPPERATAKAEALYFAYIGVLFAWSARRSADPTDIGAGLRDVFTAICACEETTR
ncbi:TetR/AcrR family transcriptional regulator [Nocardiopsis aegyptia]|uniref:TetR/AcrR family transcriptional regulator n=1 Tax=Nocardiopsis aegyptia TaxID=220378 RepID=UPI0036723500